MKRSKKQYDGVAIYDDCGERTYECDDRVCRMVSCCDDADSCYQGC